MANALPPDVDRLARALILRSERGDLAWEAVDDPETGFVHTGRAGTVLIASTDGDGQAPYTLSVLTPNGVVGDSWRSVSSDRTEAMDDYQLFQDLYDVARRSAAGATRLISDLLNEIEPDGSTF
jgi:hypothetical protein